jgi:hypothetical protein
MTTSTRTEMGYAFWKEDPQTVKEARIQAEGIIGARKIKAVYAEPIERLFNWLTKKLEGRK